MHCQELRRGHQRPPSAVQCSPGGRASWLWKLRIALGGASGADLVAPLRCGCRDSRPAIFSSSKPWSSVESIFHSVRCDRPKEIVWWRRAPLPTAACAVGLGVVRCVSRDVIPFGMCTSEL